MIQKPDYDPIDDLVVIIILILGLLTWLGLGITYAQKPTNQKLYDIRHDVPNKRIQNLANYIDTYSKKYNVDKNLVIAIIDVESDLYNVRGPTGESGYMQIKPETFKLACGYETTLNKIIYDVKEQIRCSVLHLSDLITEHGFYDAISAYNSGTPAIHNSKYVEKVLIHYNELK